MKNFGFHKQLSGKLFAGIGLLLALFMTSCAKQPETPSYTLGSGSTAGIYAAAGRALASMVNDQQARNGFRLIDELSLGSEANINAVLQGEYQFGIAQADDQYYAITGTGKWADTGPQEDLRAVFSIYEEAVTLVVGADTDIQTIADLKGKVVDIGLPGSGTRQNAIEALEAAGLNWQTDITAMEGNLDDRLAKFMKNDLDAFFFTVGHPNRDVQFSTFSMRGSRLIGLDNIEQIVATNPSYHTTHIPKEHYPRSGNMTSPETFGVRATLVTSATVPDDIVYAFTKAVFERDEKYTSIYSELSALADDKFLEGLSAPIHPGALKYFAEAGIEVPAPLAEAAQVE